MDKSQTGLAGEFYVLAQLAHRGMVASLTLGHTKGVDILVSNPALDHLLRVEVKTTSARPARERLFGPEPCFGWPLSEKHEQIDDPRLFYAFVLLQGVDRLPRFFIVPACYVAAYVKEQHKHWVRSRSGDVGKTSMRRFRIPVSDPLGFENNWAVFETGEPGGGHLTLSESWLQKGGAPAS